MPMVRQQIISLTSLYYAEKEDKNDENFVWSLDRLKLIGMVHFEKGLVTKRIAHFETNLLALDEFT